MRGRSDAAPNAMTAIAATVPAKMVPVLRVIPWVSYVEEDAVVAATQQTEPRGVLRIGARTVHGYNKGTGVKIAVIDTGIDYDHPDLAANYAGDTTSRTATTTPWTTKVMGHTSRGSSRPATTT